MTTPKKHDTPTIKCRNCFDKGIAFEAPIYKIAIGMVPREYCNSCELGKTMYETWKNLDTTKSQIKEVRKTEGKELIRRWGISQKFENFRIDNLDHNPALQNIVNNYIDQFESGRGFWLYLWGNIGSGKTTTASIVSCELAERYMTAFTMINWAAAITLIKDSFDKKGPHKGRELLQRMLTVPLLVLDDIHQEKWSDWVREQFFVVINSRYEAMLPTIITSQCPLEDVGSRYGEQIASRLMETCKVIEFTGDDRRQKQRSIF